MPQDSQQEHSVSHTPLYDRWNKDAEAQSWLLETLSSPMMEQAVGVLRELATSQGGLPSAYNALGDSLLTVKAMEMCHKDGYDHCLYNLRLLSIPSKKLTGLEHDGWRGGQVQQQALKDYPEGSEE